MIAIVVILPAIAGLLILVLRQIKFDYVMSMAAAALHTLSVLIFCFSPPESSLGGWLVLDDLGLIFLALLSFIFLLAMIFNHGYMQEEKPEHHVLSPHLFSASLMFFLATMSLVTISHHLGLLWVAVEATTLASAPLIYYQRTPESLEAAWKYLVICSVGIALALLGVFFLAAASTTENGHCPIVLKNLIAAAQSMDMNWLRAAFIFVLIGFGTKMGLAPLHTWLPDAHSEAPSGISALLSGVLLNCAFLALLRFNQILVAAGQAAFAQNLFLFFGILSLLFAAAFILNQTDYKRMLAYSSVEHMGLLAVGAGLGPAASFFMLLHMLFHSLTKAALFFTSGQILLVYQSKKIAHVQGLLRVIPWTGVLWLCGFFAVTGVPPFALFITEFNIIGIAMNKGHYLTLIVLLFSLTIVFINMAKIFLSMCHGQPTGSYHPFQRKFSLVAPPVILLLLLLIFGLYMPDALQEKFHAAAALLGGVK
jgi:hydrogenase-4 component F